MGCGASGHAEKGAPNDAQQSAADRPTPAPVGNLFLDNEGHNNVLERRRRVPPERDQRDQREDSEQMDVVEVLSLSQESSLGSPPRPATQSPEHKNKVSAAFITQDVDFDDELDSNAINGSISTQPHITNTHRQDFLYKRDLFTRNFEHEAKNAELFVQLARERLKEQEQEEKQKVQATIADDMQILEFETEF